ncbi:MAG: hypothetical protein QME73_13590 [Bacillota bacterium]|nr:hypothetical protein [Bacillota bacterium]
MIVADIIAINIIYWKWKEKLKMNKKTTFFSIVLVLLLVTAISAFAADTASPYKEFDVNGDTYKNRAEIMDYSSGLGGLQARTYVGRVSSGSVPAGYLGVKCGLYADNNGTLVSSTDWIYSSVSCVGFSSGGDLYKQSGNYYSRGSSRVYDGDGYVTTSTYRSPSTSAGSKTINEFNVNNNGQTYGNGIEADAIGYDPELIEARSIDGTIGYVYASDLEGDFVPQTPEEALAWQSQKKNIGKDRIIPVYAQDGKKIIGEFVIKGYDPSNVKYKLE